jgi:acetyl-CoA C-acetyltransferase
VTLLSVLREQGGKRGVVGICNGGGEATALAVEVL